ncbi:MAG: hypothetical protein RJB13_2418 [Pseudomonadota bacterium]|jgi:hypothetical protein
MRVDLLTLYAYSDKSHSHQRELWRGFLALVFPILLEFDAGEFERLIENAQCRSVDSLLRATESPESLTEFLWTASGQFAESLGFEAELGLSAFLDVELPSRIHSLQSLQSSGDKSNSLISEWLQAFRGVQQRPEFVEIATEWKRVFELLSDGLSDLADEDETAGYQAEPEPSTQSDEGQPSQPTSTLRKDRRRQARKKSG